MPDPPLETASGPNDAERPGARFPRFDFVTVMLLMILIVFVPHWGAE